MSYVIVGLGNPGEKYKDTRHSVGRIVLEYVRTKRKFEDWSFSKKINALLSHGKVERAQVILLLPETKMNKSGGAVKPLITSVKKAEKLIVIYDDIDLPLGSMKISYGRGSGGHRGLESIIRALKTRDFIRVRVGVSPPVRGKTRVRKPKGEKAVIDFILGDFQKREHAVIDNVAKKINQILEMIVLEGKEVAMNHFN